MFYTFKRITKIKSILNQQMNLLTQQETTHPNQHFLQVTKRNSTRPNSFIEPLPSHPSSQNDQNIYSHALIQTEPSLNRKIKTQDQLMLKDDRLYIDYFNEEAVRSIIVKIEKNEKIKMKTKICLQMVILKRGVDLNKKLSHLLEICAKKYQRYLLEEID